MAADIHCPKNKLGISDPSALTKVEADITYQAIQSILAGEIHLPAQHCVQRLCAIHEAIFDRLYEHAGKIRQTDLRKAEFANSTRGATSFAPPNEICQRLDRLFSVLRQENGYKDLDRDGFCGKATSFIVELNNIHPFEEGNGRTQRTYLTILAKEAGYNLQFDFVTQERMVRASVSASRGDTALMHEILDEQLDPVRVELLKAAYEFLEKSNYAQLNDRFLSTTKPGVEYSGIFVTGRPDSFIFHTGDSILVGSEPAMDLPESGKTISFTSSVAQRAWCSFCQSTHCMCGGDSGHVAKPR